MGLFGKFLITAGIVVANKIIDNKDEQKREELRIKKENDRLKHENEKLKIKEMAKIEVINHDYEMERLEIEAKIKIICSQCGRIIDKDSQFCGFCGQAVINKQYCNVCGKEFLKDATFCGYCGNKRSI